MEMEEDDLEVEEKEMLGEIKQRKELIVSGHRRAKSAADNAPAVPRKLDRERRSTTKAFKEHLDHMGIESEVCTLFVSFFLACFCW